jgi:hypothetical protein
LDLEVAAGLFRVYVSQNTLPAIHSASERFVSPVVSEERRGMLAYAQALFQLDSVRLATWYKQQQDHMAQLFSVNDARASIFPATPVVEAVHPFQGRFSLSGEEFLGVYCERRFVCLFILLTLDWMGCSGPLWLQLCGSRDGSTAALTVQRYV